jgi:transcriptional regulator with XRE-family HTH domain
MNASESINKTLFHKELRHARLQRGLTQDQVAVGAGISKTMVQRYETEPGKGHHALPSEATAMKIEAYLQRVKPLGEDVVLVEETADLLQDVSLDELIEEIKRRGFQLTLQSVA